MKDSELLTPQQVADEVQVHVETVRQWIRTKKLAAIQLSARDYRIKREDLNKFLEERRTDTKD